MILTPLYDDNVITPISDSVVDLVVIASNVFDEHFLTRSLWSVNGDKEKIISYFKECSLENN